MMAGTEPAGLSLLRPFLLDSGPLGKIAHPRRHPDIDAWFTRIVAVGAQIVIPEIADYEVAGEFWDRNDDLLGDVKARKVGEVLQERVLPLLVAEQE